MFASARLSNPAFKYIRNSNLCLYTLPTSTNYRNKRQFSTYTFKESHDSVWDQLSETDKLQSALDTDEPENADVAYYKGLAFKNIGPQYSGYAMAAFREALKLCRPDETELRRKCQDQLNRLETASSNITADVSNSKFQDDSMYESDKDWQLQNPLQDMKGLKELVMKQQRSIERLEGKIDRV
jgi:hypothetical protein